jgi:P-type Ca2+ transporter type 2C
VCSSDLKQASDMVILDDNFITIRNAMIQGRGTFDNIRKFVAYLLGANISEVLIIFLASVLSLGISPKIAIQLLWINLVTDGLPALALGADPPAKGIMGRKPRKKDDPILDRTTLYFIASIGVSATIAIILLYAFLLRTGNALIAQSALFSTFVVMEMLTVYVVRWKYGTDLSSNKWLHAAVLSSLLLQAAILYTPLNAFFGIAPLGIEELGAIGLSLLLFLGLLYVSMKTEAFIMHKSR